jgi:hypothetical protein
MNFPNLCAIPLRLAVVESQFPIHRQSAAEKTQVLILGELISNDLRA